MNFLSVKRAEEIAAIRQNNTVRVKSRAIWADVTKGVNERIVDFSMTWALLVQASKKPLGVVADETVGEALQYCGVQHEDVAKTLEFLDNAVAILVPTWIYGMSLQKWWNGNPVAKQHLMRK